MWLSHIFTVAVATLLSATLGQQDDCYSGKADIVMALDIETNQIDFVFMREYVKRFLKKVTLNADNGTMVSIQAYGITTSEISNFTASESELTTSLDLYRQLRPINQRNTHTVIEKIVDKFKNFNRPGVPRIAIVFVSGNSYGDYSQLKNATKVAAFEQNILFIAVTSNKEFAIRDLDAITNYVPGRIISTDYKPIGPDMAALVPAVCKHMIRGVVFFKNCTGKAHVIVGIDVQSAARFGNALNFASVLFWNVRQIRRTLLINNVNKYNRQFNPKEDSIVEFSKILNQTSNYLNAGNYDAKGMVDRIEQAFTSPTTMHTVRVAVLISDKDSGTPTQMRQAEELLRNRNIRLIVVAIQSNFQPSLPLLLSLSDNALQNRIVVSDQTLLGSGLNQIIEASCDAIVKCSGGLDVMIAMDSSYSITPIQFQQVKAYTKVIADRFVNNKIHATQLAVIGFGQNVSHVSFFGDKTVEMFENINTYVQNREDFKTNIDFAITNMTTMLTTFGRQGVPKVAITVTDGKSTRGLINLQNSARDAASKNVITMAVGIGNDYVIEELRNITNGIQDNIIETSFEDLSGVAAQQTIDRLCLFSIEGAETSKVCDGAAHITIAIDVSDTNFQSAKLFAHDLVGHMQVQPEMMVSLIVGSTGDTFNFPADTDDTTIRNTILSTSNADGTTYDHSTTIQRMENTFSTRPTMPRVALFITDGKAANSALTIATARTAASKDIQFISIGIIRNNPTTVDMTEITGIAGGIIQNRFVISEEGLLSTGINQVTQSVCLAISEWTGTELMKYMGPAEISLMFDSCDSTMYNFYRAFTTNVVRYINVEDNKVKFNAASFCSQVEPLTSYQDLYYIHQSIEYSSVMAQTTSTASQIIGDFILHFSNIRSPNKFGILLVNDASFENDLALIAQAAFQEGITLLSVGIDDGSATANLDAKLSLINKDMKTMVAFNGVNVQGTSFLITNLATLAVPGERHVAIGLVGKYPGQPLDVQYTQYNHVVTMVQNQTQQYVGDIRTNMNNQIAGAAYTGNGLAIHDAIRNIRQDFASVNGDKNMFIVTNRPAEYPELVKRQRDLAQSEGITIYVIGYRPDVTLDQLVEIAGNTDKVWFYQDSSQLIQTSTRFIQLDNNNLLGNVSNLAFAITANGMTDAAFTQVRNIVATAVDLYKQLGMLRNRTMFVSSGLIGFDGFYPVQAITNVQNLNRTVVVNSHRMLQNEPLAHSLINMHLQLAQSRVSGRPQYAVVFYTGQISNRIHVLKIADMLRASGITLLPVHMNGVGYTDSVEYKDALAFAGGISTNVNWLPQTSITNGNINPVEISNLLRNGIMKIGDYSGNIDVAMAMVGDLDTNSLKWSRRIIAAFLGTSVVYAANMKIGVFEFDQNNFAQLINFGFHTDYAKLQDAFQNENIIRMNYPRTDVSLQYIINSLTQYTSSTVIKVGVVLMDDAAFSRYITSGLAYTAYINGIYILPMRVNQASSSLTEIELIEMAYGESSNIYTVDNVAKLNTDGLVWLINKFHTLNILVPTTSTSLAPPTTTTVTTTTTTLPTTTTTATTTSTTTTSASTTSATTPRILPTSTLQECLGPADIVFALDSSDSLTSEDFVDSKDFVKAIIDNLRLGTDNIRIRSVFTFSSTLKNISYDINDKAYINILIDQATMLKVGTNTHLAIEEIIRIHDDVTTTNPKFGIIITDGLSASPQLTTQMAELAAQRGITIIAVGIRNSKYTAPEWQTMEDELLRIANFIDAHKFVVTDFDQMVKILPDVNNLICTLATTTVSTTTTTAPTTTQQYSNQCMIKCDQNAIRCFIPHPTECKFYLDCIKEAGSTQFVTYNILECGMHEFFNPDKGACDHLDEFICKQDPCFVNNWANGTSYAIPNTCDKYYKCLFTPDKAMVHTRQACQCEYKTKYNSHGDHDDHRSHCVPDTNNECSIVVLQTSTPKLTRCLKTPGVAINTYILNGKEEICPIGQVYKREMCNCDWGDFPSQPATTTTTSSTTAISQGCAPFINLDFSKLTPGNGHYQLQGSEAVAISNGEGYFGGNSFIANPQLNKNINSMFVIDTRIKFDSSSTISFTTLSLLKSCDGDPRWSIEMHADRFPSKLTTTVRFADITVPAVTIVNNKYDLFLNNYVRLRFGFNGNMVVVEISLSDTEVDRQQQSVSGTQEFRDCNGDLSFGKSFDGHEPFIGHVSSWTVYNRCTELSPDPAELFGPQIS